MLIRSLLAAFVGQVAIAAVLFVVIWWRERREKRSIAEMEQLCRDMALDADCGTRAALLEMAERYRKEQGPPE